MKLFYAPGSSSLLPHIVLREAELPFESIKINEHTKAISGGGDFRSVNPLGYAPVLPLLMRSRLRAFIRGQPLSRIDDAHTTSESGELRQNPCITGPLIPRSPT